MRAEQVRRLKEALPMERQATGEIQQALTNAGSALGVQVLLQREETFRVMHRV